MLACRIMAHWLPTLSCHAKEAFYAEQASESSDDETELTGLADRAAAGVPGTASCIWEWPS